MSVSTTSCKPSATFSSSGASKIVPTANTFSKNLRYHLKTLFLFTKSDVKTTLVPITIFALGTAPVCRSHPVENTLKAVFWLWMVLLQFNLINQTVLPEEDAENKPWRPIPSGRISLRNAIILRWISIPLCALISSYFGTAVLISCIMFTFWASVYNFFDGDKNGFVKNLINGFGSCSLALGTTLVASCGSTSKSIAETLHWKNFPELTIFFFVLITTIHAQDFQDVEGDRSVGRNTVPMIIPEASRVSMPVLLPLWSVIIVGLCNPPAWLGAIFIGLSVVIGFRFFMMRQVQDDKMSYILYNLWLSLTIVHMGLYKRPTPKAVSWSYEPSLNNYTRAQAYC